MDRSPTVAGRSVYKVIRSALCRYLKRKEGVSRTIFRDEPFGPVQEALDVSVLVKSRIAVADGVPTGVLAGRALPKGADGTRQPATGNWSLAAGADSRSRTARR